MPAAPRPAHDPAPDLDVIVVAYGPATALEGALAALGGAHPVVVVDNASAPETARVAERAGARYVDPGRNTGFAAGVNTALEHLRGDGRDVLLLNPDARIGTEDLDRLHARLHADPGLACAAPALREPGTGRPGRSCWPWHTPVGAWAEAVGLARRRLDSRRYFVGGAVLLMRRAALEDVGGLDERFFLYSEDEDWQRRAVGRGWRVLHCPDIVADHGGGGTETDARRLRLRLHAAIEVYVRKWYGAPGWAVYRAGTLAGLALRAVSPRPARRRSARRLARIYLAGPARAARSAGAVPPLPSRPDRGTPGWDEPG